MTLNQRLTSMNPNDHPIAKKLMFKSYVAAVIDFLNQSERLKELRRIPETLAERRRFLQAAKASVGTVYTWRDHFRHAFSLAIQDPKKGSLYASLSPDNQRLYERLMDVSLGYQHFSDTIVLYSPLLNAHGDLTASGFYGILSACANMMLLAFSMGVVFRGGVDVGVGVEARTGELYGPVLYQAHHLENRVAEYPRVVLGEQALHYLSSRTIGGPSSFVGQYNAAMARVCQALICKDHDGCAIVDFLGQGFHDLVGQACDPKPIREGFEFVSREYARFEEAGNIKLANRYGRLRDYYLARQNLWLE